MKTPKEMAEEYVYAWWGPREDNMTLATRQSFLAGYQAGRSNSEAVQAAKESNFLEKPDGSNSSNNSNGWISVKDRLPEINNRMSEDVLMLDEYGQMSVEPFEIVNNKIVVDWGEAGTRLLSDFTHWMPLPKPPEE
jgi:hypothetical protein